MSVSDYLAALAPDRRDSLSRVRDAIVRNLPAGYEESVAFGMITYSVPLARYPDTYNGQPLMYCGLASQKNYMSLYLMPAYGSTALAQRLRDGFRSSGKKLDMGKSCIRFRAADDLALETIGEIVAAVPVDKWVEIAQAARAGTKSGASTSGTKPRGGRSAAKRARTKATAKRAKPTRAKPKRAKPKRRK